MDTKAMYKRFSELTWQEQLANLASTLARISSQALDPESDKLIATSLREAALIIEWSAPQAPSEFLLELAAMQREALTWQRAWPINEARHLLSLHTHNQSERLLQMTGLLAIEERKIAMLESVAA